jgi:hypothetical protein
MTNRRREISRVGREREGGMGSGIERKVDIQSRISCIDDRLAKDQWSSGATMIASRN